MLLLWERDNRQNGKEKLIKKTIQKNFPEMKDLDLRMEKEYQMGEISPKTKTHHFRQKKKKKIYKLQIKKK